MNGIPVSHARGSQRFSWLVIPLFVLATGSQFHCWCSGEAHEPQCSESAAQHCVALSGRHDTLREELHASGAPCSPDHDCCCDETGSPLSQVPERSAPERQAASLQIAAPLARVLPVPRTIRTRALQPEVPRQHSPPLIVLNCVFRC